MDSVMDKIQERFTFGSIEEENFRFCGRRIESKDDYYEITCPELLSKVKPIHIEGRRDRSPLTQRVQRSNRRCGPSWEASATSPDFVGQSFPTDVLRLKGSKRDLNIRIL